MLPIVSCHRKECQSIVIKKSFIEMEIELDFGGLAGRKKETITSNLCISLFYEKRVKKEKRQNTGSCVLERRL